MISSNTSSSPKSSSNSSKSSQPGNNFIQVTRPLFRGEFKNYKVDKPKKMSTKTMKSTQKKPNESSTIKLKVPTPNTQKKESIMSQLTFHESYSKDLCPFGSAKVKNNPVRNHPYVQQFVLNTCQSTSTVMDSGSCSTFSSLSNGRSPKLTFKAPIENIQTSLQSGFKTCPQKENFIFHFKVDGGNIQQQSNNYQNSSCQQSFQTSFNSSSSCSSMSSSQNSNSNSSSFVAFPNQSASCVNAKPVMMETVVHEPELIILPPFRQVDKSENIRIPSMKYIESLIHSKGIQSQ